MVLRNWEADSYARWHDNPRGRAVERMERQALRRAIPREKAGPLLDIGCGDGRFTTGLVTEGTLTIGLDPSAGMLTAAATRFPENHFNIGWVQGAGEKLPFRSEQFVVVVLHLVLAFTDTPGRVLSEAFRVLRPDGTLVVAERSKDKSPSLPSTMDLLQRAGFDVRFRFGTLHAPLKFRSPLIWKVVEWWEPILRVLRYPPAVTYYSATKPAGLKYDYNRKERR